MIRTETYSANDPIHGLQLHAGESACITMSRIHQGVPLYDRVKILEIRTDALLMQAQNSLVLVDSAGTIHLHSEHLPYPIQGQMLDQDLSKSLFLLGELAYMPEGWKERSQVRVQPGAPVYFTMQKMGCLLRANLLDLDVTGLGASTDHDFIDLLANDIDYSVNMDLNLTPELSINALHGTICYAHDINSKAIRLGIHTRPTPEQANLLTRYIEGRHSRIMDELLDSYTHALAPAPVQNLYF
jgi:hypothetical protein